MQHSEKKNKRRSVTGTIVFHAFILIILLFLGLSAPYPPPPEAGVIVDIGFAETGFGENNSEAIDKNILDESAQEEVQYEETLDKKTEEAIMQEEVLTQDKEEAPVIKKDHEKEMPKTEEKKQPVIDTKSLYKGKKQDNTNAASSQGNTSGDNNQGAPEGQPSNNYTPGLGTGDIGYSLAGRNMTIKPTIKDDSQETGKVNISIKVDRKGKVVYAKYTLKGSTTSNPYLVSLSEKASYKAKFNTDTTAPEEQWGSITFVFKVR